MDQITTEKDLGECANIVVRLLNNTPQNKIHPVYFDNYHTTIPLLVQLVKHGNFVLTGMSRNRISNCPLFSKQLKKKADRGESKEFLTEIDCLTL